MISKTFCEASLCPAPLLTIDEEYKWQNLSPQIPTPEFLGKLQEHEIFSFWGFFPLTKDGMFVSIYPKGTKEKMVFVPYQKVLLSPMQIPFVNKLRTSIIGSPHCKFCIYIIPDTLEESILEEVFGGHDGSVPVIPFVIPEDSATDAIKTLEEWVGF
jgi:hypothetical protein